MMPGIESKCPRYLQTSEQVLDPEESYFTGEIPDWLNGSLYSSSPGVFDLEKGSVNNWFDGYAIISKFEIKDGKVTFSSKHLQSTAFNKALENKRPVMPEFGTPPHTQNIFAKFLPFGPYDCTDNTVGTIFKLGSDLYTAGDTCYFNEIDAKTLDTLKRHHTAKTFGMNSLSSQPVEDAQGNIFLIGGAIQPTFRYTVLKMSKGDKDKALEKRFQPLASFPSRWMFGACPVRNFGMTENYVVMVEMPLVLNLMKLAGTYVKGYCTTDWLDWRPQDGVRFCIISKREGTLLKTEIVSQTPFFTPTIINAFEDGEKIVLDLISMPNLDCNKETVLQKLRERSDCTIPIEKRSLDSGQIHRYIIPLIASINQVPEGENLIQLINPGEEQDIKPKISIPQSYNSVGAVRKGDTLVLTPEICSELGMDFQVINPNYKGKQYTFVYTTSGFISTQFSPFAFGIAKLNLETKEVVMWKGKEKQVVSEPVFVSNPNDSSEDGGILLALVKNERAYEHDDFLVAVDAKNMTEVGRAVIKSQVAAWYHATFFPNNAKCQ